jgi:hypothetical protein
MKLEAVSVFETAVTRHVEIRCHRLENLNSNFHHHGTSKLVRFKELLKTTVLSIFWSTDWQCMKPRVSINVQYR